jgi:hypothetical protein
VKRAKGSFIRLALRPRTISTLLVGLLIATAAVAAPDDDALAALLHAAADSGSERVDYIEALGWVLARATAKGPDSCRHVGAVEMDQEKTVNYLVCPASIARGTAYGSEQWPAPKAVSQKTLDEAFAQGAASETLFGGYTAHVSFPVPNQDCGALLIRIMRGDDLVSEYPHFTCRGLAVAQR